MPIPIKCDGCGYQTHVSDASAGKSGRCPKCGATVQVPDPNAPPVVDAETVDLASLADGEVISVAPPPPSPGGSATDDKRPCPMCGELIAPNALKCRFCNEIFDPRLKKEEARKRGGGGFVGGEGDSLTVAEWLIAILCSGIGCIVGIVWMLSGRPKGKKMFAVSLIAAVFWTVVRFAIEASQQP